MAKIEHIKNKRNEIVYPVTKEGAIYDDNGVLLSSKIATFITRLVDNLANYYLKSETYTKEEVDNLISAIQSFTYIVVSELPTASALTMGIIYLVPSEDPQAQNVKDEYITIRSGSIGSYTYSWEQIGSTAIDLSGYVTTEALNAELAKYTTTANLTTLLAGKQDAISDLSTIRSGAAAGATAYQKPGTGIPVTDMASGVQASLGKADTAYQKPSPGVPKTDLASGVQNSLSRVDESYVRPYDSENPNGMGYLVLEKGKTFASQVTDTNTIYEIRYDFDLNDASVTIPAGCVLKFEGGKLSKGAITGNGDYVIQSNVLCFEDMAQVDGYANDTAYLHWFNDGNRTDAEITSAVQLLMDNTYVSKICLDASEISLTQAIKIRNGKMVFGLGGFLRDHNYPQTTISPSSSFSKVDSPDALLYWENTVNISRASVFGLKFDGNFVVGNAILHTNNSTNTLSVDIHNNCFLNFTSFALIILACENCKIYDNYGRNLGGFVYAAPYTFDEDDPLSFATPRGGVINFLNINGNYVGIINYGLVLSIGTEANIANNSIDYVSTYLIYIRTIEGVVNIRDNSFESAGAANFWVNQNGVEGSISGNTMTPTLANSHMQGGESVIGWGFLITSLRVRPMVFVYSLLSRTSLNASGNFYSIFRARTDIDAIVPAGSPDDTTIGVDTIYLIGAGKYSLGGDSLLLHDNLSKYPRTYICRRNGMQGLETNRATVNVTSLPIQYEKKDWFYQFYPITIDTYLSVDAKMHGEVIIDPRKKVVASLASRSIVNINKLLSPVSIIDGIPYWNFPSRGTSPAYGYYTLLFDANLFATAKFIRFPIIYNGNGAPTIIYNINSWKNNARTQRFASADTVSGVTYTVFVSNLLFGDMPDQIEIALRPSADDAGLLIGLPLIYQLDGKLVSPIDFANPFDYPTSGSTAQRPSASTVGAGFTYFDTDLGKMIVSNGTDWVNMDGTALS